MPGSMIDRYLKARTAAAEMNDQALVAEIDRNMAQLGYRPDAPASRDRAEANADAAAVPRGRGDHAHRNS